MTISLKGSSHMTRLKVCVVASVLLGAPLVAMTSAHSQAVGRRIFYDPRIPIAARLIAGDTTVIVQKPSPEGHGAPFVDKESLAEEIQLLSQHDTIAVVSIVGSSSEFVDGDAWIRTRLHGHATQLLKPGSLVSASGAVQFWEDGGSLKIKDVTIIAGVYPIFIDKQDYLLFLRTDGSRGTAYAARAFRVSAQGVVEAMKLTTEGNVVDDSNLIGRRISELASAFAKKK